MMASPKRTTSDTRIDRNRHPINRSRLTSEMTARGGRNPDLTSRLTEAIDDLNSFASRESELWRPFLRQLPIAGASLCTLVEFVGLETVSASSRQAARLDELQFDLGESTCWEAMRTATSVHEPDIRGHPNSAWPAFSAVVHGEDIGAIFAFPLVFGFLRLGAIDLYTEEASSLSKVQEDEAILLTGVASRLILSRALQLADGDGNPEAEPKYSRRVIQQATGMVLAQLGVTAADALLVIQGHAFATDQSMNEVANRIVARQLNSSVTTAGIENSHG
jgi:hypothetical protein